MSRPTILLVDDSDAVLEFEQAVLSAHYQTLRARNGKEALERVAASAPAAILLDLSMPELDGDEVLARLRGDPRTAAIPVIIVSSEGERARACLSRGAQLALEKPVRAEQLIEAVGAVLAAVRREKAARAVAVLPVKTGPLALALPLRLVDRVSWMAETLPLPGGPSYLCRAVEVEGAPVAVLELAHRLGFSPARPLVDRRLVLTRLEAGRLAVLVDEVDTPEEAFPEATWSAEQLDAGSRALLASALQVVRLSSGALVPVVDPGALLGRGLRARLEPAAAPREDRGGR